MSYNKFIKKLDKTPLKSKKFLFALLGVTVLTGLIALLIILQPINIPAAILGSVLALGLTFVIVGYVLGVVALEKLAAGLQGLGGAFGGNSDGDNFDGSGGSEE